MTRMNVWGNPVPRHAAQPAPPALRFEPEPGNLSEREQDARRIRDYAERNRLLRAMGFADYRAYLASPLWASIRQRVLCRDRSRCRVCRHRAFQVHHLDYSDSTLRGKAIDRLATICNLCHAEAEFTADGRKRGPQAANAAIAATLALTGKKKSHFQLMRSQQYRHLIQQHTYATRYRKQPATT